MRPSRFTEEEILQALRQVRGGTSAAQVCRNLAISQTTFYRWRKSHGDGAPGAIRDARELRELRVQNQKLKLMVANLLLDTMP